MMKKYFPYYKEPTEATRIENITEFMANLPEPGNVLDDAKRVKKINSEKRLERKEKSVGNLITMPYLQSSFNRDEGVEAEQIL
jgi:hypothetical protein